MPVCRLLSEVILGVVYLRNVVTLNKSSNRRKLMSMLNHFYKALSKC